MSCHRVWGALSVIVVFGCGGSTPAVSSPAPDDDAAAEVAPAAPTDRFATLVERCTTTCERLAPCPAEEGVAASECARTCQDQGELIRQAGCLPTWEEGIACAESASRCEPEMCEGALRVAMDCAIAFCAHNANEPSCRVLE